MAMSWIDAPVECACPVCGAAVQTVGLLSTPYYTSRKDEPDTIYPASPCKGKHTRREILEALQLTHIIDKLERENPAELNRIVGK